MRDTRRALGATLMACACGLALACTSYEAAAPQTAAPQPPFPASIRPVYALKTNETVFAYSRISPDGRFLAYASEARRPGRQGPLRTINVVDLSNGSVLFEEPGI